MNRNILLAIFSGSLLWLAWPPLSFTALLFVALVPLLFIEEHSTSVKKLFGNTYLLFFTWNLLTTWWIWNASPFGAVMAVLTNSLLMSIPVIFFHRTKKVFGERVGYVSLVCYWVAFEYIHMQWELSWPWLTLGNGFANAYRWVQWYEYTGVFGGTVWIWVANILAFLFIKAFMKYKTDGGLRINLIAQVVRFMLLVFVPLLVSLLIYYSYSEKNNPTNVVVVQPNIDPYNEKFDEMPPDQQLARLVRLSDSLGQPNTEFFIWPETALSGFYENQMQQEPLIKQTQRFLEKYKNGNVLAGAATYRQYHSKETETARLYRDSSCCYDAFNTALLLENSPRIQVYHKSKLVPGVERMPYPGLFSFLEKYALDLGGTFGSLGTQEERTVFYSQFGIGAAPVICYESVYGEYLAEFIKNGAQFIAIITNDGWWGNTSGYKQHCSYANLRAIEARRAVARSANTGTSCFINQRGDISQATGWWKPAVIKADINLNDELTFYVKHGDYIGRAAAILSLLFLLLLLLRRLIPMQFV